MADPLSLVPIFPPNHAGRALTNSFSLNIIRSSKPTAKKLPFLSYRWRTCYSSLGSGLCPTVLFPTSWHFKHPSHTVRHLLTISIHDLLIFFFITEVTNLHYLSVSLSLIFLASFISPQSQLCWKNSKPYILNSVSYFISGKTTSTQRGSTENGAICWPQSNMSQCRVTKELGWGFSPGDWDKDKEWDTGRSLTEKSTWKSEEMKKTIQELCESQRCLASWSGNGTEGKPIWPSLRQHATVVKAWREVQANILIFCNNYTVLECSVHLTHSSKTKFL